MIVRQVEIFQALRESGIERDSRVISETEIQEGAHGDTKFTKMVEPGQRPKTIKVLVIFVVLVLTVIGSILSKVIQPELA